jgi:glycerophosphoryl diester phosphodiesterase
LINHRGLSPGLPENTLAAFRYSLRLGVDVIELDLRGTKDHVPVVMHDATVDRTTNGSGAVETFTLKRLKKLDAGSHVSGRFSNERVPSYEEVLQFLTGTGVKLLLDIKPSKTLVPRRVVSLTKKYRAESDTIVGARTFAHVALFRRLSPKIRILGFVKTRKEIQPFIHAGADIIRLWPQWIEANPHLVRRIQLSGHPVWVTADDAGRRQLLKLIRLGANGILSDRPELLAALLRDVKHGTVKV